MLKLKLQYFGHLMQRTDSLKKTLMLVNIERRRRRGWQRMKMVGWHQGLDAHKFQQAPGVGHGWKSLACFSPRGRKESDRTEQLNWWSSKLGTLWIIKSETGICFSGVPQLFVVSLQPWRRNWQCTPVFLTGECHGQRSLAGYSPWGCKELDTTEQLSMSS